MNNQEYVHNYLSEVKTIVDQISQKDIEVAIQLFQEAWKNNRRVFIAGNGGSSATATHFASDLAKYTIVEGKHRFKAVALTDNVPWLTALTNDAGWGSVFVEQLKNLMEKGDFYVAISVHGGSGTDKAGPWSQNILAAAKYVKDNGGKVIGFAGFDGGILKEMADVCIVVPMNSTPHVEGFHLVLTHLICDRLKMLIQES